MIGGMDHPYPPAAEGNLNISDVIEVIQTTDPDCAESQLESFGPGSSSMYPSMEATVDARRRAYVKILEQPASKALRFRYECEGRSAGSIPGIHSTPENKTFPSIQVVGYKGRAVVVVSCVTKDPPYRPHPHNLVGKEGCKKGVCTMEINNDNMVCTFSNLGIQCVKKKDIEDALRVREEIRVDPYRTGFSHRSQPTNLDLNAVRLCFQVFLEGPESGKFTLPLTPVVSDPIFDKKAMSDLVICKLSDCTCTVAGGKEIILLCEKVAKEDIQVRFYEEVDGKLKWEGFADFQPTHVHKQVAISFRTPRYQILEVNTAVKVSIQLLRPSDGATSEPLPFEFLPLDSVQLGRKRQKFAISSSNVRHMEESGAEKRQALDPVMSFGVGNPSGDPGLQLLHSVKCEPADPGASYIFRHGCLSPMYPGVTSPSPQPPEFSANRNPAMSPTPQQSLAPHIVTHTVVQRTPSPMNPIVSMGYLATSGGMTYISSQGQSLGGCEQPGPAVSPHSFSPQTVSAAQTHMAVQNMSSVLDLDNQQYSLEPILGPLDSADLAGYSLPLSDGNLSLFDTALSENLSSHLTLSDRDPEGSRPVRGKEEAQNNMGGCGNMEEGISQTSQENMSTDSITRLTTRTIQELCTLNNIYKGGNSDQP